MQIQDTADQIIINIEITLRDRETIREQKILRVKEVGKIVAYLSERSCNNCILEFTKEELYQSAIKLAAKDYLVDLSSLIMDVKEFRLTLHSGHKLKIKGNKLNKKAIRKIDKLAPGSIIIYDDYKLVSHMYLNKIPPIKILITEAL